jgi:hypothetical protein
MMDWFDPAAGVVLMHPTGVKDGMRHAREIKGPDGEPATELTPIWNSGYSNGAWFRTSDGQLHSFYSDPYGNGATYVWVQPEILPESMPPHKGRWVTNRRFIPTDEGLGWTTDRHFYQRTREVDKFVAKDGRVYRLLHGRSYRWEDTRQGGALVVVLGLPVGSGCEVARPEP